MTITLVLVSLTIVITGSAIDAWKGARTEIRASSQAKAMLSVLGRDLESLVIRRGTDAEWLYVNAGETDIGPDGQPSPNAAEFFFLTAAADRYNGNAGGGPGDEGGNISAVGYKLDYEDPVFGDPDERFSTFVLYRKLLDPRETFDAVIGSDDLKETFETRGGRNELEDLICENIYEFTVTFVIEYQDRTQDNELRTVRIPVLATGGAEDTERTFSITGAGIEPGNNPSSEFRGGRITSVDLSITVLSDTGIEILKKRTFRENDDKARFLEQNGFRYAKSVIIPQR